MKATQTAQHTPGYEVSRDGRVYSVLSNWRGYGRRELAQTLNDDGYPSVRIYVAGKRTRLAVYKLVALHLPSEDETRAENARLASLAETISQNVADIQQAIKDVLPSGMQDAVIERLDAIQAAREQQE